MPNQRLINLKASLEPTTLLFVSNPKHIDYLTGFGFLVPEEREAFFAVTSTTAFLMHVSFSPSPQENDFEIKKGLYATQVQAHLSELIERDQVQRILFDAGSLFVDEHEILETLTKKHDLTLEKQKEDLIAALRMVKDTSEIEAIGKASTVTAQCFDRVKPRIKKGMTELEVKRLLEATMVKLGSEQPAFPTIVAFGPNTALPHHQPGNTKLTEDTAVLLDFGASVNGYRSDMTRSWWFGSKPNEKYLQIQNSVHQAYRYALDAVEKKIASTLTTSLAARDIDLAARNHIHQQGFGQYFIHTTGHGLGLDIHEAPSLSSQNTTAIKENMVITIEPGIYLPGEFGYRYENTVVVTNTSPRILTVTSIE